jgi:hypothetical protein
MVISANPTPWGILSAPQRVRIIQKVENTIHPPRDMGDWERST